MLMLAIDSLLKTLLGGDSSQQRFERLTIACVVPILTTAIWNTARTVVEVTDSERKRWVQQWLLHQKSSLARARRLFLLPPSSMQSRRGCSSDDQNHLRDEDRNQHGDILTPPNLFLIPSNGILTWAWFGCWPVSISTFQYSIYDDDARSYSITIWFAPSGAAVAKELILQGREMWLAKRSKTTEIWTRSRHFDSFAVANRKSRPLASVIVEDGVKEDLREDAIRFLGAELWYTKKGIPYRRGYLLYGPPGCGKTSLVTALAGDLRLPIVLVTLGSKNFDDEALFHVLSEAPRYSIVLIEDVDCAFIEDDSLDLMQERMRMQHVTLSGLLNAIDGVAAQEGRLLFMTTNHKDRLSEALIRPGRVDVQYEFRPASKSGAGDLFDQFFPPSQHSHTKEARDEFVAEVEDRVHSFAKLQGVLMQSRDDPHAAAEKMRVANNN